MSNESRKHIEITPSGDLEHDKTKLTESILLSTIKYDLQTGKGVQTNADGSTEEVRGPKLYVAPYADADQKRLDDIDREFGLLDKLEREVEINPGEYATRKEWVLVGLFVTIILAIILFVAAIIVWAPSAKADSWAYSDPDDNPVLMQEFANTLAFVEEKYGTGPLEVDSEWMEPNIYAVANGSGITINKVWSTGSIEALNHQIAIDAEAGWGNPGCNGVRTVALHEVAHVIDARKYIKPRLVAAAYFGPTPELSGQLSGYSFNADGTLNYPEALAEAFQAFECGTADQSEMELWAILASDY